MCEPQNLPLSSPSQAHPLIMTSDRGTQAPTPSNPEGPEKGDDDIFMGDLN